MVGLLVCFHPFKPDSKAYSRSLLGLRLGDKRALLEILRSLFHLIRSSHPQKHWHTDTKNTAESKEFYSNDVQHRGSKQEA